jgi:hypothetical protein
MIDVKGVDFDDDGVEGKLARGGERLHRLGCVFFLLFGPCTPVNSGFGKNHVDFFFGSYDS